MYFNTALSIGMVTETIVSSFTTFTTIVKSTMSKTMQKNVHKKSNNSNNASNIASQGIQLYQLDGYCADDEQGLAHNLAPAGYPAALRGRPYRCTPRPQ